MSFFSTFLYDKCFHIAPIRWQRVLENSQVMRSIVHKMLLTISDKLSKESCIATYLFSKEVLRLV